MSSALQLGLRRLYGADDAVRSGFRNAVFRSLFKVALLLAMTLAAPFAAAQSSQPVRVPVLVYHRFGPSLADNMTMRTADFAAELGYLNENHYTVIPARQLVDYLCNKGTPPRARAVVITVDDAHRSVFSDMLPLVEKYKIPVTLFVYPSAVSNASYAMTWEQLAELKRTGLFHIQSHTFWHPNFKQERKRLSPEAYDRFVRDQLTKAKAVLERRLGGRVDMLAWPFGIYDAELIRIAEQTGYVAGFTLERRPAGPPDNVMSIPRYLMAGNVSPATFAAIVSGRAR
jgi:peptidoglycan/xylan/chitin deacetylase (PgdA/CDA1 family)